MRPSGFGAPGRRGGHAGRLSAAGTVAKIDLRLLHHPVRSPLPAPVRPLKSVPGDSRPSGSCSNSLAARRSLPSAAAVRRFPSSRQQRAPSGRCRCDGPPAWAREPRRGPEPRRQRVVSGASLFYHFTLRETPERHTGHTVLVCVRFYLARVWVCVRVCATSAVLVPFELLGVLACCGESLGMFVRIFRPPG